MVFTQKNRTFPHPINYTRARKHGAKNYSLSKIDAFPELWELKQNHIKKYVLAPLQVSRLFRKDISSVLVSFKDVLGMEHGWTEQTGSRGRLWHCPVTAGQQWWHGWLPGVPPLGPFSALNMRPPDSIPKSLSSLWSPANWLTREELQGREKEWEPRNHASKGQNKDLTAEGRALLCVLGLPPRPTQEGRHRVPKPVSTTEK